jgi:1,4-dihydroxy-2-naphthoate octaprenyltransferase
VGFFFFFDSLKHLVLSGQNYISKLALNAQNLLKISSYTVYAFVPGVFLHVYVWELLTLVCVCVCVCVCVYNFGESVFLYVGLGDLI